MSKNALLSDPAPAWLSVAEKHAPLDALCNEVYRLPLAEFRKVPYNASPLPSNVPQPGQDLAIRIDSVTVRDGTSVGLRIYSPPAKNEGRLLFFNVHAGGWMVGTPETEEAQNRFVAVGNDAVGNDAVVWCISHAATLGIGPQRIIFGGGSAGANIVAALTLLLRDDLQGATVIVQVLNISVTFLPAHFPAEKYELLSYLQNKHTPLVDASCRHLYWNNYIRAADAANPLTSPLLATSHTGLPQALV